MGCGFARSGDECPDERVQVSASRSGQGDHGGFGPSVEYDMQRFYRDARSATIAAGGSQTQRNLIAGLMGLKPGR